MGPTGVRGRVHRGVAGPAHSRQPPDAGCRLDGGCHRHLPAVAGFGVGDPRRHRALGRAAVAGPRARTAQSAAACPGRIGWAAGPVPASFHAMVAPDLARLRPARDHAPPRRRGDVLLERAGDRLGQRHVLAGRLRRGDDRVPRRDLAGRLRGAPATLGGRHRVDAGGPPQPGRLSPAEPPPRPADPGAPVRQGLWRPSGGGDRLAERDGLPAGRPDSHLRRRTRPGEGSPVARGRSRAAAGAAGDPRPDLFQGGHPGRLRDRRHRPVALAAPGGPGAARRRRGGRGGTCPVVPPGAQ